MRVVLLPIVGFCSVLLFGFAVFSTSLSRSPVSTEASGEGVSSIRCWVCRAAGHVCLSSFTARPACPLQHCSAPPWEVPRHSRAGKLP